MREETRLHMATAIRGLGYSLEEIERRLLGEKRGYPEQQAQHGPFAQALGRVADIADGAPVESVEQTRSDLLSLFEMLRYLHGGFWASGWAILNPVHAQVAEPLSAKEAATILGEPESVLAIYERLGRLHALDYLGEIWARYEVEALKAQLDAALGPALAAKLRGLAALGEQEGRTDGGT